MAKWGRGPNRAFGHVHNWQIRLDNWDRRLATNEVGWQGFYANRYWECIRGGVVKHTSPSEEYPLPTNLYGRKWNEGFDMPEGQKRVFLAMSGYTYHAENSS